MTSGDGTKTVYYQCKDNAGNTASPVSDTIILDTAAPTSLSIVINNGDIYTASLEVNLTLFALTANECRYSNDGSTWSAWEAYSTSKSWNINTIDGTKTVYYTCRDFAGNIAPSVSDTIILDTLPLNPPAPQIVWNINGTVNITWAAIPSASSYNIYAVNTCSGLSGSFTQIASGLTSTMWIDNSADIYSERYYRVSSVRAPSESLSNYSVGKYDVYLVPGWNLVSTPLEPQYTGIKPFSVSVFTSLHSLGVTDFGPSYNGSYDFVVGPVNDGSVTLGSFNPYIPSFLGQNLLRVSEKISFQILMNQADVLTVVGIVPNSTSMVLSSADWFWIGYPSCSSRTIKPFFTSIFGTLHDGVAIDFGAGFDGNYDFAIGPMSPGVSLGTFDPFKNPILPQNLQSVAPGRGYVLKTLRSDTLVVPYSI